MDMKQFTEQMISAFVETHHEETIELLKELAAIPAPSCKEEKRAVFIKNWLIQQGTAGVTIDDAGNVVYLYSGQVNGDPVSEILQNEEKEKPDGQLTVIMAHMDVVFPDTEPFHVKEQDGKLFAPGVGDDTANLVNLMMTVKFLTEQQVLSDTPILFVANTGEEGLGNLKGSREIWRVYGSRIKQWISLDLYLNGLCSSAVGSQRYQVTVKTRGGHSYEDFGEENAIAQMAEMISDLYQQKVPTETKTTYNVGMIEGGTSVNTIAQSATMAYEFRSESADCLKRMEESFEAVIAKHQRSGKDIAVKTLGIRPGKGDIDEEKQEALVQRCLSVMKKHYDGDIIVEAASTDSNIPLSNGVPAVTIGTVMGGQLHTREEWIETESMKEGQALAIEMALTCLEEKE